MRRPDSELEKRGSFRKLLLIGLAIFVLLVLGVLIIAWTMGDAWLPMQYEGFD